MITLLHTADWHLGQTFFDYDRKEEHRLFLTWLQQQLQEHSVDVLLIAGDVFDSPNPSAESQRMYYQFLSDVTKAMPALQIVLIAGNHDSAARLEAPVPLLEAMNITVRGLLRRREDNTLDYEHLIVPLNKGGYCLAVPYVRAGDLSVGEGYSEGVTHIYNELLQRVAGKPGPKIAMGHLQATGSELSLSDRAERAVIGGLECVSPDMFDHQVDYVALGHIHRSQRVSKRDYVRYAGAPLPMSFAEKNNRHGAVLVSIEKETKMELLLFEAPVKLISLSSEPIVLAEVLERIGQLPDGEVTALSPLLEIVVKVTGPDPSMRSQINEALKGKAVRLARIGSESSSVDVPHRVVELDDFKKITPLELASTMYLKKYGEEMPDDLKEKFNLVLKEVDR